MPTTDARGAHYVAKIASVPHADRAFPYHVFADGVWTESATTLANAQTLAADIRATSPHVAIAYYFGFNA